MYKFLDLSDIKASGYMKEFLITQSDNLTGEIDLVGYPFCGNYWGNNHPTKKDFPEAFFNQIHQLEFCVC